MSRRHRRFDLTWQRAETPGVILLKLMRIGEILVQRGAVTAEQVDEAQIRQKRYRLGSTLLELGHTHVDAVSRALAQQKQVPSARLEHFKDADKNAVTILDPNLAARHYAVALGFLDIDEKQLVVAMRDPENDAAVREIEAATGYQVIRCVVAEALLRKALDRFYGVQPVLEVANLSSERHATSTGISLEAPRVTNMFPALSGPYPVVEPPPQAKPEQVVNGVCAVHPDHTTAFVCPECDTEWCFECSDHHWTKGGFVDRCRKCQHILAVVGGRRSHGAKSVSATRLFFSRLPELLRFPLTRSGLVLLLVLSLVTVMLGQGSLFLAPMLSGGIAIASFGWFAAAGIELMIFLGLVTATASGKEDIQLSDLLSFNELIFFPLWRIIVAYLPLVATLIWWTFSVHGPLQLHSFVTLLDEPTNFRAVIGVVSLPAIAVLFSVALLPLLILIAAISSSFLRVLNPLVWFRTLRVIGALYIVGEVLFLALYAFDRLWLQPTLSGLVVDDRVFVVFVTAFVTTFVGYVAPFMAMRVLGGLIEPHLNELRAAAS